MTQENISYLLSRVLILMVLGPVLLTPMYSMSRWSGWKWSKWDTFWLLCGLFIWLWLLGWVIA